MILNKRRISAAAIGSIVLIGICWVGLPVYGFKAHQGKVPISPFGWSALPANAPETQELYDKRYADSADRAQQILRRHRAKIDAPALSAAIAIDGQLIWAGTVGWSNIATGEPASPRTRFRIGSTSKIVTATLLARLAERGTISLDMPIGEYYSPLPNDAWAPITLRQLASHQSGLPHYKENTDIVGLYRSIALNKRFGDVRDAVSVFDGSELLSEPGTAFHYSTLGTVLLAAAMSHASETSYRELVNREIVIPLGVGSIAEAPKSAKGLPDVAVSYFVSDDRFRPWRPVDMTHRLPGGGFVATSSDLAKLGMAWLDEDYLSRQTRETFWKPQALADGRINEQNYALGFRWSQWESQPGIAVFHANHGGVSRGAQSWLMILPEQRISLAFNTNRKTQAFSEFGIVYRELLSAFMPLQVRPVD